MTRDEILAMKPGRELDRLVATRIMEWSQLRQRVNGAWICNPPEGGKARKPPCYSSDISAAWQVVERMRENKWGVAVDVSGWVDWSNRCIMSKQTQKIEYYGDTVPEAICKAALLAVVVP